MFSNQNYLSLDTYLKTFVPQRESNTQFLRFNQKLAHRGSILDTLCLYLIKTNFRSRYLSKILPYLPTYLIFFRNVMFSAWNLRYTPMTVYVLLWLAGTWQFLSLIPSTFSSKAYLKRRKDYKYDEGHFIIQYLLIISLTSVVQKRV